MKWLNFILDLFTIKRSLRGDGMKPLPKELIDERDFKFSEVSSGKQLLTKVDNRSLCGPGRSQSRSNSCVGFSIASIYDKALKNEGVIFSPLFTYYYARQVRGWENQDKGCYIFDAIKQTSKRGVCPEKLHPFSLPNVFKNPDTIADGFAKLVGFTHDYYKIKDANTDGQWVDDMKIALQDGYDVVGGVRIYPEFSRPRSGIVSMPKDVNDYNGAHCLLPGTLVRTNDGVKKIEDIKVGDKVLTHLGNYKKVTECIRHDVNEHVLEIIPTTGKSVMVTKEHPFYTKKYSPQTKLCQTKDTGMLSKNIEWVKAEQLEPGYLLYEPINNSTQHIESIYETKDFFRLLGYYMGDGNISIRYSKNGNIKSACLRFSLAKKDKELIDNCQRILLKYTENCLGIDDFENHINLNCYDTHLALKIGEFCGWAKNKKLNEKILHSSPELQKEIIIGWYETDGCYETTAKTIQTSEEYMFEDLCWLLKRNNILFSYSVKEEGTYRIRGKTGIQKKSYRVRVTDFNIDRTKHSSIYDSIYRIRKIKDIKEHHYKGKVFNLEVEDDNSYTANGIAVHNCVHYVGYVDLDKGVYDKALSGELTFTDVLNNPSKKPSRYGFFIFKNSWSGYGRDWFGMVPYHYVQSWGQDFWAIKVKPTSK